MTAPAKPRVRWTRRGWFVPITYVFPWWEEGQTKEYRVKVLHGPCSTIAGALEKADAEIRSAKRSARYRENMHKAP